MRNKLVVGNWKMNTTIDEAIALINNLNKELNEQKTVVCVPFTHISELSKIKKANITIGAQDISAHSSGAYTGEISNAMLKSLNVKYVLVGHSERREYHNETNTVVNTKVKKALESGITPIICFGESLTLRKENKHLNFIENQIKEALLNISAEEFKQCVLAYEPIWAIGTGETASPSQAQEVHAFARDLLTKLYTEDLSEKCKILYGGSVKPSNASALFKEKDIDGALVGGASLKAIDFTQIINA